MLKLGIIGTSAITHNFVTAAHESQGYQLSAVFSRSLDKAEAFAKSYGNLSLFTDWADFLASDLDVIYIASPNSLHFHQAKAVLEAGKHAIVEKPMVSTPTELHILKETAAKHQVFVFEAARNHHEPAFQQISNFLADKTILGAYFGYAKYSSKMPELLAGQTPNIFSADFSGGALMDLGIYPVYAAVTLFGKPKTATYKASQLPSSVDLRGSGQLFYDGFYVTIEAGKNMTSYFPSEIYTDKGTLTLNACQHIQSAVFCSNDGQVTELAIDFEADTMLTEAKHFAQAIERKDLELATDWLTAAQAVHDTLYTMRQDAQIQFKADLDVN